MIGIFNDSYPPILDGVAVTAQNYAYWLSERGEDVCMVAPEAPGMDYNTPYPLYTFHSLPIPVRKPYRFGVAQLDPKFIMKIRAMEFDLVHAHCPFATGRLALSIAKRQHIPLVATFHSKYRDDFSRVIPSKMVVNTILRNIVSFFNQADEVWIPQASVEETIRDYGYKGPLTVVENGNDFLTPKPQLDLMRLAKRQALGLAPEETMLLFVGQLIWEKGIDTILDAVAQHKELPCKLYLVGEGYAASGIRKRVEELGIAHKVVMTGPIVDRAQLQLYYAAADLFLFPSVYDTFGIVVREAAAMHTPALLQGGTDAAKAIIPGVNGFVTIPGERSYADMLRWLVEHPEARQSAGDDAAVTLTRSWEQVADEVSQRYQEIRARYAVEKG